MHTDRPTTRTYRQTRHAGIYLTQADRLTQTDISTQRQAHADKLTLMDKRMSIDRQTDARRYTCTHARGQKGLPACACRETGSCKQKYRQTHEDRQTCRPTCRASTADSQAGACRQTYTCRQTEMQTHSD